MNIKQIYTNCLSQASYFIESEGDCLIIDPIRDIDQYDEIIKKNNYNLKYVLETHFHADFISGHLELSNKYNVPIVFGPNSETSFKSIIKNDGDFIQLGALKIQIIHTPGHTLESVCYLLFDEENNQNALFTGDTLFIGDIGRPDLAIDNNLSVQDLASMLYDSLYNKILKLDENIIIYPAHGPGTQCGKNLCQETFSSLKEQKKSNYALKFNSKAEFISSITSDLPPAPDYFRDSALLNKNGYKAKFEIDSKSLISINEFELLSFYQDDVVFIDTRPQKEFSKYHLKDSINISLTGRFAITAANLINVNSKIIVVFSEGDQNESVYRLNRVGYENILGYHIFNDNNDKIIDYMRSLPSEKSSECHLLDNYTFLDVRTKSEYQTKHVKNAINIPLFDIGNRLSDFDQSKKYLVYCQSGYRSSVASSFLIKNNINNIINVSEGINGLLENKLIQFN